MSSMEPWRLRDLRERLLLICFFYFGAFLRRLADIMLELRFRVDRCCFRDLADLSDLWDREERSGPAG